MSFLGALLSSLGFASANVAIKKALLKTTIPQTLFLMTFSGIIALFTAGILSQFAGSELNEDYLKWILILGFSDFATYVLLYKAFEAGEVAIATGLICLYPLVSIFITTVFLKETLELNKIILILIILAGGIITSIDWRAIIRKKQINFAKGLGWIILGIIAYGVHYPLLGTFTATGSWIFKLYGIKIISIICIYLFYRLLRREPLIPKNPRNITAPLLIGIFEIIGWAGFAWANNTSSGQVGIITVLLNMVTVFTSIGAMIALKERLHKMHYFGILTVTIGLVGLAL